MSRITLSAPWAAHAQIEWENRAAPTTLPLWLRIVCLAYGRHEANGHANFGRGQLSWILGTPPADEKPFQRAHWGTVYNATLTYPGSGASGKINYVSGNEYNDVESLEAAVRQAGPDLAAIFASPIKHDTFVDQEPPCPDYARRARAGCVAALYDGRGRFTYCRSGYCRCGYCRCGERCAAHFSARRHCRVARGDVERRVALAGEKRCEIELNGMAVDCVFGRRVA